MDRLWIDPGEVFRRRGIDPDPWQVESAHRSLLSTLGVLLLCCRQAGKSETDASIILLTVLLTPPALILVLSKTYRQAMELLSYKFMPMYEPWRKFCPMKPGGDLKMSKEFVNGSRIVVLPDEEGNIRAFSSVNLIVLDEASRVSDNLYRAVLPMLAVSRGRVLASSTAFGQRGWFFDEYVDKQREWLRFDVQGKDVRRLGPKFLADMRRKMGERWYRQEYENSFEAAVGQVFSPDDITRSFSRAQESEAWSDLFDVFAPENPKLNVVPAQGVEMP